jgi:hypothetical protein
MRKIDLDFRRPSPRRNTRVGFLLLVMGVLTVIWMVTLHNDAQIEQQRIQSLLTQRHGTHAYQSSAQEKGPALEFQRAAAVIEQLSFPWNKLFQAIEENAGADMALLSIQPDMAARTVMLDAEAKDWGGMVSYIKRLEEDRFFSDVHVVSHQTQQSDPDRPVRFKLSCTWVMSLESASSPTPTSGQ